MAGDDDDDWKRWPGYRADPAGFWRKARVGQRGVVPNEQSRVTLLPRDRRARADVRLQFIAEQAGRTLTKFQKDNREALANGETASQPVGILAQTWRFVKGGRTQLIEWIRFAAADGNPDAVSWWHVFAELSASEQQKVALEHVCEAAGVRPSKLMGLIVSAAMELGQDAADFVAAQHYPDVVDQTHKSALRINGKYAAIAQEDRRMILEHGKFIAGPKAGSVNINTSVQAAAAAANQPSVPSFASALSSAMGARTDAQKQITATLDADVQP